MYMLRCGVDLDGFNEDVTSFLCYLNTAVKHPVDISPPTSPPCSHTKRCKSWRHLCSLVGGKDDCLLHACRSLGFPVVENSSGPFPFYAKAVGLLQQFGVTPVPVSVHQLVPGRYLKAYQGHATAIMIREGSVQVQELDGSPDNRTDAFYNSVADMPGRLD